MNVTLAASIRLLGLVALTIGHVALAVWVLNVCYGQPWPKKRLRRIRKLHLVWLAVGTPLVLLWYTAYPAPLPWIVHPAPAGLYVMLCWLATGVFVAVQAARALRRPVAWQRANHTRVVDLEQRLGYRPVAKGPKWRFAFLRGNEQFRLEVLQKEFVLPTLPEALDGLQILHLTDWHFSGVLTPRFYEAVIEEALTLGTPDLVALTGDYIDNPACYDWIPALFSRLQGRYGQFAVVGNHDNWFDVPRIKEKLQQAGFTLATPHGKLITVGSAQLWVAGTEWPWIGSLPAPAPQEPRTFALLLSHGPDAAYAASERGYHLMLCGHNHGGQVRLPLIGPVYMPSRYGRRFDAGLFRIGNMALYVNKGLGGEHPLRLGARPEIAWIVLRTAALQCPNRRTTLRPAAATSR